MVVRSPAGAQRLPRENQSCSDEACVCQRAGLTGTAGEPWGSVEYSLRTTNFILASRWKGLASLLTASQTHPESPRLGNGGRSQPET